jgi:hypothetical protein
MNGFLCGLHCSTTIKDVSAGWCHSPNHHVISYTLMNATKIIRSILMTPTHSFGNNALEAVSPLTPPNGIRNMPVVTRKCPNDALMCHA